MSNNPPFCALPSLTFCSTNDDNALRAKVSEAMNVYDEYVRSREQDGAKADGANAENEKPQSVGEEKA